MYIEKTDLRTRRAGSHVGIEVLGVDIAAGVDAETFERIESLYDDNGVLFLRGQNLTETQQIEFSRRFGELDTIVLKQYLHPRHPEIFIVSNVVENGRSIGSNDAGQFWHTDASHFQVPARGSLLYAKEVPVKDGKTLGNTLFSSMYAAYDSLSPDMKTRLAPLKAIHRFGDRYNKRLEVIKSREGSHRELTQQERELPSAVHPVIRRHPRTGRHCLYVNEGLTTAIVGMEREESDALLAELFTHCVRPEFVYSHTWQVGDLLIWDNCSTQHCALADYALPQRRVMYRTTVKGQP